MDFSILWVLIGAWLFACGYYMLKLLRIARGKGVSVFSLLAQSKKSSSQSRTRKLFQNIIIATIFFIIAVSIAYFVGASS